MARRYRAMLNEFLFLKIEEDDMDDIWFQWEGVTCHTDNVTIDLPSRSYNLTPLDYFLWGVLRP